MMRGAGICCAIRIMRKEQEQEQQSNRNPTIGQALITLGFGEQHVRTKRTQAAPIIVATIV